MEYVKFGKTGLEVSRFGLGCMRFPPDENEAVQMVRCAIDGGVNYIDTAYIYKGSEETVGRAVRDGYRRRAYIATKSPMWNITRHGDFEKFLDEQLIRLGTDYIDVYLFHNLYKGQWEKFKRYDGFTFIDKMIKKGKIRYKGFSIHSTFDVFKEIIDSYSWDMAQIQLNILDAHSQVGVEGLSYAAKKGVAMVIMEPLRGGYLGCLPEEARALIGAYPEKRSIIEWCFRWLYNMPEVSVILSGTSTVGQLKDNLRIFEKASPDCMSDGDLKLIEKIRASFESKKNIGCTGCKYCMPCPQNVGIPDIFKLYNTYQSVTEASHSPDLGDKAIYQNVFLPSGMGADRCISCGACKSRCPQSLDIPKLLSKVHTEMTDVRLP